MNKNNLITKALVLFILPAILISCSLFSGDEVGRLEINKLSTEGNIEISETTIDIKAGDEITIWTDMDLEYEGNIELRHYLEISLEGEVLEEITIDPFGKNVTLNEFQKSINDNTEWRFSGKSKEITFDKDGEYTFKAYLVAGFNDEIIIKKADLVLRNKYSLEPL